MKKIDIHSAGVVIYRESPDGAICYLLLQYIGNYWDFAKGKRERGETLAQTALREVREEAGLVVDLEKNFFYELEYTFTNSMKGRVNKKVSYFIGKAGMENVCLSHEHKNYIWLPYQEALELTTYQNSKDLLVRAHAYLKECGIIRSC